MYVCVWERERERQIDNIENLALRELIYSDIDEVCREKFFENFGRKKKNKAQTAQQVVS